MDPGASLEDTPRRELRAETGPEAGALTLVTILSGAEFFCELPKGDETEVADLRYFDIDAQPDAFEKVASAAPPRFLRWRRGVHGNGAVPGGAN